jgi:hypothetical protein
MEASKKLAETEWEDNNHPLIVPFYLLIGFSLENALKAVLEFNASNKSTNCFHSHDLRKLREIAATHGFRLGPDLREFIDHLSPLHKDHHFRYPQKAEIAHLLEALPGRSVNRATTYQRVFGYRWHQADDRMIRSPSDGLGSAQSAVKPSSWRALRAGTRNG